MKVVGVLSVLRWPVVTGVAGTTSPVRRQVLRVENDHVVHIDPEYFVTVMPPAPAALARGDVDMLMRVYAPRPRDVAERLGVSMVQVRDLLVGGDWRDTGWAVEGKHEVQRLAEAIRNEPELTWVALAKAYIHERERPMPQLEDSVEDVASVV